MSTPITCTPRTLDEKDDLDAARLATEINPCNRPHLEQLGLLIDSQWITPEFLATLTTRYWEPQGRWLGVGFLDDPEPELRRRILSHMNVWSQTAHVRFRLSDSPESAEVRISRQPTHDRRWSGHWSFLGTDALFRAGPFNQTMNLEGFTMNTEESEFARVVRHQAGHALGFPHEHLDRSMIGRIDRDKAVAYYAAYSGWSREMTLCQILTPFEDRTIRAPAYADSASIMRYQIPSSITTDGRPIPGASDLSHRDACFAARIYPPL